MRIAIEGPQLTAMPFLIKQNICRIQDFIHCTIRIVWGEGEGVEIPEPLPLYNYEALAVMDMHTAGSIATNNN